MTLRYPITISFWLFANGHHLIFHGIGQSLYIIFVLSERKNVGKIYTYMGRCKSSFLVFLITSYVEYKETRLKDEYK